MITSASAGPTRKLEPPAEVQAEEIQEGQRDQRADDRAGPVGSVHSDVHPAAVLRRDHLVDRRVDRRVLPADARARDEPGQVQERHPARPGAGRRRGQAAADQVDRQGHREQLLAAELVRQLAEEQRPDYLPHQVDSGDPADGGRRQMQRLRLGERRRHRARKRDLQPVQHPGCAQRHDQPGMEPGPWKPVHPRRDQAPDRRRGSLLRYGHRCVSFPPVPTSGWRTTHASQWSKPPNSK